MRAQLTTIVPGMKERIGRGLVYRAVMIFYCTDQNSRNGDSDTGRRSGKRE
jgi:hypothetical protein